MSAPMHTPGPWVRLDRADYAEIIQFDGSSGPVIAMVAKPADANLIAAAPELLEAWEEHFAAAEELAQLEREGDYTKRFDDALMRQERAEAKARTAIAKARGAA